MAICSKAKHPFCYIKTLHGITGGAHINIYFRWSSMESQKEFPSSTRAATPNKSNIWTKLSYLELDAIAASWNRATSRYLSSTFFHSLAQFSLGSCCSFRSIKSWVRQKDISVQSKRNFIAKKKDTESTLSNASDVAWTQTAFINNIFNNHFIAA